LDVFYEECAVNQKGSRGEKVYKILNIAFWVCTLISIFAVITILMNITIGNPGELTGDALLAYQYSQSMLFLGVFGVSTFGSVAVALFFLKRRININYDYVFVSGELRIVKVFNVNRRKLVTRLQQDSILQLGDVENESYTRLLADPTNKLVVCTANSEPATGKFFMYVHASEPIGKRLYVLECREELLVNILHFVKRGTLEPDYVMQEKKQK